MSTTFLQLLKSKLHHARITGLDVEYEGSIGISMALMDAVGLVPGELVHIWAVDHSARLMTYVIPTPESEAVVINGGAANQFKVGDRVVIASFALSDEKISPKIVALDERNRVISLRNEILAE